MAPSKNIEREAREARERLRRYNARREVHARQVRRRRRDNVLSVVGVLIVATLATVTQVLYFTAGPGVPSSKPSAIPSASTSASPVAGKNVGDVPPATLAENRTWTGALDLNKVTLGIEINGGSAPQASSVFISLVKKGFYTTTGSTCHRLTTSETAKLIQCGSVNGNGTGDEGFSFGPLENVPADGVYPAGTIAMARGAAPFSQSTQFFITYADTTLDSSTGGYTVFGKVTSGLSSFVSAIADAGVAPVSGSTTTPSDGSPVVPTTITKVTVR